MAGTEKPLVFTLHADDVVSERLLLREWVERTVRAPEWTEPEPRGGGIERRFCAIPENGNRVLRVVCLETAGESVY